MEKQFWNIYGKRYDLSKFMDKHPGGRRILELTRGNNDLTPLFESYHAMSNINNIKDMLKKYEIDSNGCETNYTFNEDEFYYTLKRRIKRYFGKDSSVIKKIKINYIWIFKVMMMTLSFFYLFLNAFVFNNFSFVYDCISSFTSGVIIIMLGFCVMHDASHYALFAKNAKCNELLCNIVNSIYLWNSDLWLFHHSISHHAYTGDPNKDPDLLFTQPIVRKSRYISKQKYLKISNKLLPYITYFYLFIFPGFYLGSAIVYWFIWKKRGYLWKMSKPNSTTNSFIENLISGSLSLLVIASHFYRFNIIVSLLFIIGANITYGCCILPDHDTFETSINHISKNKDWGEIQVRNSGNFENGRFYDLFCFLFGGINYQIEHHLFPSICHVHYPKISKIVKKTCQEFDIPYVSHPTLYSALNDFTKSILILNKPKEKIKCN